MTYNAAHATKCAGGAAVLHDGGTTMILGVEHGRPAAVMINDDAAARNADCACSVITTSRSLQSVSEPVAAPCRNFVAAQSGPSVRPSAKLKNRILLARRSYVTGGRPHTAR